MHLLLALRYPLAPDETYYWEWSRHLGWGYYDQGPMIAWVIRAGCLLFGDTVLGVRAGIVAVSFLTTLCVYLFFRDVTGPESAAAALGLSVTTPLALVGGFVATYDPLAILFWAAASYFAGRAVLRGSVGAWLWAGASFGLGLLSKHTTALLVPCVAIVLAGSPGARRWLCRREPYSGLAFGLLLYAPNLVWQAGHRWMTFHHLLNLTGAGNDQSLLRRIGDYVGSQVGLITPLLFLGYVAALWWASSRRGEGEKGRRGQDSAILCRGEGATPDSGPEHLNTRTPEHPANSAPSAALWLLFSLSAPVLLFFLLMAFKSKVQANWAAAGWLTPPLLYVQWLRGRGKASRWFAGAAVALCAAVSLCLAVPEVRVRLGIRIPEAWDAQVNKMYGGAELGAAADAERRQMEAEGAGPVTPGAATYDNASRLSFYMTGRPEAYCFFLDTRPNSYLLWNDRVRPRTGGSAIVVDDYPAGDPRRPRFESVFGRVVPVPQPVAVYRRGIYTNPVHLYYLYRCYGYHYNPVAERPSGS